MIDRLRLPALLEPRRPARAILAGWAATTIPAILLSMLVSSIFPQAKSPDFGDVSADLFLRLVVMAPLLETLIMAAVLEVLLLLLPPPAAVVASSIGWGLAHSFIAFAWGLIIWWPFLIFSTLYVTWRGEGRLAAIAIVFAVHALNNLGPAALMVFA